MNEVFGFIGRKIILIHSIFYMHTLKKNREADDFEWLSTAANSSTPLKITSTSEGIRLYTFVSYYNDLLPVTWHYKWVPQPALPRLTFTTTKPQKYGVFAEHSVTSLPGIPPSPSLTASRAAWWEISCGCRSQSPQRRTQASTPSSSATGKEAWGGRWSCLDRVSTAVDLKY